MEETRGHTWCRLHSLELAVKPPPLAGGSVGMAHSHVLPPDQLLLATMQTFKSGFCKHLEPLPGMLLVYVSVLPGTKDPLRVYSFSEDAMLSFK